MEHWMERHGNQAIGMKVTGSGAGRMRTRMRMMMMMMMVTRCGNGGLSSGEDNELIQGGRG